MYKFTKPALKNCVGAKNVINQRYMYSMSQSILLK